MSTWKRLLRKPLAVISLLWLATIVVACLLAPWIAPYGPEDQDLTQVLSAPTSEHWLGSGELGKDVLSRLLYGGRTTLLGVLISVTVFAVVGGIAGLVAGYKGGWIDRLVLRISDIVYSVPVVIVLLVVLAIFPGNESIAMVVLGLVGAPSLARILRSVTIGLREELYVRAARASGLSDALIMRRHVLPRLVGPLIVQLSLFGTAAVGLETGLGFLGLGVQSATWGTVVSEASENVGTQPWLLVPSGLLIITFILALGLLGDAVRDVTAERAAPRARKVRRGIRAKRPEPAHESASLLAVRGLEVTFPVDGVDTPVVQGVDLDVSRGEVVGLVGESGCGKTVTASAVLGLLRGGEITAGTVTFDGQQLVGASREDMRAIRGGRIGWISQDPISSLDPSFTVQSQLIDAIRAHQSVSRREAKARVRELLESVRLPDVERVARSYPHQLSGGMAQRVGIAAALACSPDLVIADEPTTALDVTVQAEILDLLRGLREQGTAVVLVTHDWGVLADLCDRAVVMYAGQVVETATVVDMVERPQHPYTEALLAANPHQAEAGSALKSIEGTVPPPGSWPAGCHFADRCPLVTAECRTAPVALALAPDQPVEAELSTAAARMTRCLHAEQMREVSHV